MLSKKKQTLISNSIKYYLSESMNGISVEKRHQHQKGTSKAKRRGGGLINNENEAQLKKKQKKNKSSKKIFPSEYTILLVDDEPDISLTLKAELENNGFAKVDVFNDPLLAMSSYKPGFYDFAIIDVKMPKINGFELYRELEKKEEDNKRKAIKTCFITAHEVYYESLKTEFPSLNVGCFISKPIEIEDLISRLKAL
jgi:CheY-like chemotaxis protein